MTGVDRKTRSRIPSNDAGFCPTFTILVIGGLSSDQLEIGEVIVLVVPVRASFGRWAIL
jgi:hypothetical protein